MSFLVRITASTDHGSNTLAKRPLHSSDTGAGSHIVAPEAVAEAYYSRVPGAVLDTGFPDHETLWYVFLNSET